MAGLLKRQADYVPYAQKVELDKMSKADLMEVAYSLALRLTGCEDWCEAYQIVKSEHEILAQSECRKPVKLADGVQPSNREQVYLAKIEAGIAPGWMIRAYGDMSEAAE